MWETCIADSESLHTSHLAVRDDASTVAILAKSSPRAHAAVHACSKQSPAGPFSCEPGVKMRLAVGENQWYHFGVGVPPILAYFSGDWDVHFLVRDFDPWSTESAPKIDAPPVPRLWLRAAVLRCESLARNCCGGPVPAIQRCVSDVQHPTQGSTI